MTEDSSYFSSNVLMLFVSLNVMSIKSDAEFNYFKSLTTKIISESLKYFEHRINSNRNSNSKTHRKSRSVFYQNDEVTKFSTTNEEYQLSASKVRRSNSCRTKKTEDHGHQPKQCRHTFYLKFNDGEINSNEREDELLARKKTIRSNRKLLWSDMVETSNANLCAELDTMKRRLIEAKYELITSEASYLNGLNIFKTIFVDCKTLSGSLGVEIFSDILKIRKLSENFLHDLAGKMEENYMLENILNVVHTYVRDSFIQYIPYCSRFSFNDCLIESLRRNNPQFTAELERIECQSECHHTLQEYLVMPIQRITRIPLLIEVIKKNLNDTSEEFKLCETILVLLKNIVQQCDQSLDINKCSQRR